MLSAALTWSLVLAINQYYMLRVPFLLGAIVAFLPAILIYLFDLNKKNAVSYLFVLGIIPFTMLIFWLRKINPMNWMNDLIGWASIYNGSKDLYVGSHARFIVFAVACVSAIIFYLLMKNQFAKMLLALLLIITLISLSIMKVNMNKPTICIGIFYVLTIIVELYGTLYSRKTGRTDRKEGILYLTPVCLLLALLAIILPSKAEPIQWKGFRFIYTNIVEQIEDWKIDIDYYFSSKKSEFTINITGYSEGDGELSNDGTLKPNDKVALKVSVEQGVKPIYLIGSVSDIYTGHSWEKSREDFLPGEYEYILDYTELIYALSRLEPEVLQNNRFVERRSMNTLFSNIKTRTFFYPIKTSLYEVKKSKSAKLDAVSANITLPKLYGRGTTYDSIYYEMNLQGEAFQQMLREANAFTYDQPGIINEESYEWLVDNVFRRDQNNLIKKRVDIYEILSSRADMIERQYSSLPEAVPDRVKKLALEITANFDTTYDKLKAIESFLRDYKYTLSPRQAPEGMEFTDYFLFESQEGYCTSFATAMAVLGRCIGVPTRYVEGFIVKYEDQDDKNRYLVRNRQAHAWAEAYIEGVGWIPFEATANYFTLRYTKWRELTSQSGSAYENHDNPYAQQYLQDKLGLNQGGLEPLTMSEEKKSSTEILTGAIITISAILLLVVIVLIYYLILRYRYNKVFYKSDYSRKMYMLLLRILNLLKLEGYQMNQQETVLMLAGRVSNKYQYYNTSFTRVTDVFMKYRYAEEDITEDEFDIVERFHKGLSAMRRDQQNKLISWFEELIFLARKGYR
jgi:Ca2+/Na+ antiporter